MTVGFIGLGKMGGPMAVKVAKAAHIAYCGGPVDGTQLGRDVGVFRATPGGPETLR